MTVVNTNVAALSAATSMMKNTKDMESAMAKLSSGYRINTAADDAAGLSISEKLEGQIRGTAMAVRNAQDAQNMIDTIEGASAEIVTSLQRLRELAVQSANSTNSSVDRSFLQKEASQLLQEIDRIAHQTQFNGMNVLDGSFDDKSIQAGANVNNSIAVDAASMAAQDIGQYVIRGQATDSAAAAAGADNGYSAGNIVLNGFAGTATVASSANDTAREARDDINAIADKTGVTAKAATNVHLSAVSAAGTIQLTIGHNGAVGVGADTATTVTATVSDTEDLTALRDAINNAAGSTGVTAKFFEGSTDELLLTDQDGDDIQLNNYTNGTATITVQAYNFHGTSASAGGAATTVTSGGTADSITIAGELVLGSSQAFSISNVTATYFGATTSNQSSLENVGDIDIGSLVGAVKALDRIDGAIDMVNTQRAELGAMSNRLDKTINNLTNVVENHSATKSHIKDANFAQETSQLTKAQILNQAATSVLAQANASKQTVLALLQN